MFYLIEELICSRTFCLYCQTPSSELVDRHNRDFMVVGLYLHTQSMPITTTCLWVWF